MTICFVCVKGGGNFAPLKLQNATKCRIFISPSAATALKGKKSYYKQFIHSYSFTT